MSQQQDENRAGSPAVWVDMKSCDLERALEKKKEVSKDEMLPGVWTPGGSFLQHLPKASKFKGWLRAFLTYCQES